MGCLQGLFQGFSRVSLFLMGLKGFRVYSGFLEGILSLCLVLVFFGSRVLGFRA